MAFLILGAFLQSFLKPFWDWLTNRNNLIVTDTIQTTTGQQIAAVLSVRVDKISEPSFLDTFADSGAKNIDDFMISASKIRAKSLDHIKSELANSELVVRGIRVRNNKNKYITLQLEFLDQGVLLNSGTLQRVDKKEKVQIEISPRELKWDLSFLVISGYSRVATDQPPLHRSVTLSVDGKEVLSSPVEIERNSNMLSAMKFFHRRRNLLFFTMLLAGLYVANRAVTLVSNIWLDPVTEAAPIVNPQSMPSDEAQPE